jgi:hypothetical protein
MLQISFMGLVYSASAQSGLESDTEWENRAELRARFADEWFMIKSKDYIRGLPHPEDKPWYISIENGNVILSGDKEYKRGYDVISDDTVIFFTEVYVASHNGNVLQSRAGDLLFKKSFIDELLLLNKDKIDFLLWNRFKAKGGLINFYTEARPGVEGYFYSSTLEQFGHGDWFIDADNKFYMIVSSSKTTEIVLDISNRKITVDGNEYRAVKEPRG